MSEKEIPFNLEKVKDIVKSHPTPFHIYSEEKIRETCRDLYSAFSFAPRFKNFFAVKATPNPYILEVIKSEGLGADCSSANEIILSQAVGFKGSDMVFTSNNTKLSEYKLALDSGALINFDDLTHLEIFSTKFDFPEMVSCRYNPGLAKQGNVIIGKPEEAKFGFTKEQLMIAYKELKAKGVKSFGLHAMVASNELNEDYFADTAKMLFGLVSEIKKELEIEIELVNLGGGIGIPYKPEDKAINLIELGRLIEKMYNDIIVPLNLDKPLNIVMENGRFITGPSGYLVTKCINHKNIYKNYVGVDATMSDLMRPGMYGAYHHISVLGKDGQATETVDVVGSLCENNDKFAIDRDIPKTERGDYLVIHDSGAHGHSMGFQYNAKLRSAEILLKEDGNVELIRRAETKNDYFGTLDFGKYKSLLS